MVGVVAGEAQHPRHNLPRAIRTLMWRIFIFYIVSMLFLTFVVPYDLPGLVGGSNSSPFVLAIKDAGIEVLPHILNAVVMVCVCSVGSTSIYISSRTLKAMAEDGFAWQILGKTDRRGRPYVALIFTGIVAAVLAYLNCSSTGAVVFSWYVCLHPPSPEAPTHASQVLGHIGNGFLHRLARHHRLELEISSGAQGAERRHARTSFCFQAGALSLAVDIRLCRHPLHGRSAMDPEA